MYKHTHTCQVHANFNVPYLPLGSAQILGEHCHLPCARLGCFTLSFEDEIANSL